MIEQENRHGAHRTGEPAGAGVTLTFEGNPIPAFAGDTVATALLAAGQRIFKFTEVAGDARGGFCYSGRCSDCMLIIDGQANRRACVTPVRDGMDVRIQHGLGAAEPEAGS